MTSRSFLKFGLLVGLAVTLTACGGSYHTVLPTTDNTIRFKARDHADGINIQDEMSVKATEHCAQFDRIARLSASKKDGSYVWQTYACIDSTES